MSNQNVIAQNDRFQLGSPALVCRWRLSGAKLALESRHLHALRERSKEFKLLTPQLVSWAKQHIEWTLQEGAQAYPDGVLMLVVDNQGQAAMTVGPYQDIKATSSRALALRALASQKEAQETGIAPETLWAVKDKTLICGLPLHQSASGASSLITDLAKTLGILIERQESLAENSYELADERFDELFLVSDEHGVVLANDTKHDFSQKFAASYQDLLKKMRKTA